MAASIVSRLADKALLHCKWAGMLFLLITISVPSYRLFSAQAVTYVDVNLHQDCTHSDYSIAKHDCSGTDGNAYSTVHAAVDAISPGSTIYVRGGTYRELVTQGKSPVRSSSFDFKKSMTISGYAGEKVVLTYDPQNLPREDADKGAIIKVSSPNVTIEHLTVVGTHSLGDNVTQDTDIDIWILNNAANTVIRNNTILDFGHSGIKGGSAGLVIEFNEIADGGFTQRDHGIYTGDEGQKDKTIRYNNIHNASGYGIQIYSYGTYYKVYGNVIHDNDTGGIVITGNHNDIVGNLIINNGQVRQQGGINFFHYGLYNLTVKDNIIVDNQAADINCQLESSSPGDNSFSDNLIGLFVDECIGDGDTLSFWTSKASHQDQSMWHSGG